MMLGEGGEAFGEKWDESGEPLGEIRGIEGSQKGRGVLYALSFAKFQTDDVEHFLTIGIAVILAPLSHRHLRVLLQGHIDDVNLS